MLHIKLPLPIAIAAGVLIVGGGLGLTGYYLGSTKSNGGNDTHNNQTAAEATTDSEKLATTAANSSASTEMTTSQGFQKTG